MPIRLNIRPAAMGSSLAKELLTATAIILLPNRPLQKSAKKFSLLLTGYFRLKRLKNQFPFFLPRILSFYYVARHWFNKHL